MLILYYSDSDIYFFGNIHIQYKNVNIFQVLQVY